MSKKIRCTVTGNITYVTEKRYALMVAKYGGEERFKSEYISTQGHKIRRGEADAPEQFKNRIRCAVTGRWCYISTERINAGIAKNGSREEFERQYICRPAARMIREGFSIDDVRRMAKEGTLPEA